jgi:transaldolase
MGICCGACRCDNITISPSLLGELEQSKDPLPRKLWPTMGGCDEPQVDMHESNKSLFDKLHGEDQMAVDKLKEGIEGASGRVHPKPLDL